MSISISVVNELSDIVLKKIAERKEALRNSSKKRLEKQLSEMVSKKHKNLGIEKYRDQHVKLTEQKEKLSHELRAVENLMYQNAGEGMVKLGDSDPSWVGFKSWTSSETRFSDALTKIKDDTWVSLLMNDEITGVEMNRLNTIESELREKLLLANTNAAVQSLVSSILSELSNKVI